MERGAFPEGKEQPDIMYDFTMPFKFLRMTGLIYVRGNSTVALTQKRWEGRLRLGIKSPLRGAGSALSAIEVYPSMGRKTRLKNSTSKKKPNCFEIRKNTQSQVNIQWEMRKFTNERVLSVQVHYSQIGKVYLPISIGWDVGCGLWKVCVTANSNQV